MSVSKRPRRSTDGATTQEVMEAAGRTRATILNWEAWGLLPPKQIRRLGNRGNYALWPPEAVEIARRQFHVAEALQLERRFRVL